MSNTHTLGAVHRERGEFLGVRASGTLTHMTTEQTEFDPKRPVHDGMYAAGSVPATATRRERMADDG